MAFCPNCEAEYKPNIAVCEDCNLDLVPELSPQTRVHDIERGEPTPFRTFQTSSQADLVMELLKGQGVRSFVTGGSFSVLPGAFSQEIVVMVDQRDLVRANELYEAYFIPGPSNEETNEQ